MNSQQKNSAATSFCKTDQLVAALFFCWHTGGKASPWGTVGHPLRTLGERCLLIRMCQKSYSVTFDKSNKT